MSKKIRKVLLLGPFNRVAKGPPIIFVHDKKTQRGFSFHKKMLERPFSHNLETQILKILPSAPTTIVAPHGVTDLSPLNFDVTIKALLSI